jgi:hypothetical protein
VGYEKFILKLHLLKIRRVMEMEEENQCPVCLDKFSKLQNPYKCGHGICSGCESKWRKPCPVCRTPLIQPQLSTWTGLAVLLGADISLKKLYFTLNLWGNMNTMSLCLIRGNSAYATSKIYILNGDGRAFHEVTESAHIKDWFLQLLNNPNWNLTRSNIMILSNKDGIEIPPRVNSIMVNNMLEIT